MNSIDIGKLTVNDLKEDSRIVEPGIPISKVIGVLREWGVYQVFTQMGDKVGMISMRDLLKVTNITTRKTSSTITYVPKLGPKQGVESAAGIMERYRVRALPIVEDHEISGQINTVSIVKAMNRNHLKKFKINSIMIGSPIVLGVNDSVAKARKIMVRRRIDHIPIVADRRIEGVTTSSHIVFKMLPSQSVETGAMGAEKQNRLDFPLKRIIDTPPVTCKVEDRIADVLEEMLRRRSTYSVASLWGEVQGITTYRDFLKLVAAEKSRLDIPVYMVGLPEDPFEAEATRDKFLRTVGGLKKVFPEIIEARSIIKTKSIRSDRRRYEVRTILKTPYDTYSYTEGGYDLPSVYDVIS
ncbi:MAG: CBS domain-containing protein, partial [Nitrososphaerales archaeon]